MRVLKDILTAVLVGVIGGVIVSGFSYYQDHKEGGVKQTMNAVLNSFDTVADAYSGIDGDSLFTGAENAQWDEEIVQTLEEMQGQDTAAVSGAVLNSILSENLTQESETDILAMEGENGGIGYGAPYSGILRFHVRANSDSEEDQELKMAVKEDVVAMLKPLLKDCENVAESKKVIISNLQPIYETAVNTITEQGYDYKVKVYMTTEEFPAKTYGDLTFPEGKYQALRVDIGAAQGQNWWCVMYPPLCFIDESPAVV